MNIAVTAIAVIALTVAVLTFLGQRALGNDVQSQVRELEKNLSELKSRAVFEEINAERINIVDADGTIRLVMHNEDRVPGDWERPYPIAGIVFHADNGWEVGGIAVMENTLQFYADEYGNDRVVGVINWEAPGGSQRGLRVWDRYQGNSKQFKEEMGREPGPFELETPRFFGGQRHGEALVALADSKGRERLRMVVDNNDVPRIEFLDEQGRVERTFPEESTRQLVLPDMELPKLPGGITSLHLLLHMGNDLENFANSLEGEGLPAEWHDWAQKVVELNSKK